MGVDSFVVEFLSGMCVDSFVVEFLSTYVLLYSGVYMSATENDSWAQFMSVTATIAVLICIKDRYYLPPDASPTTTITLWLNSAYTDINGNTEWG